MGMLDGRVSLVTAAGGGIAGAIARRFAGEGAKVCCVDINEDTVNQTVTDIEKEGGTAIAKICNVASETEVKTCVNETASIFGKLDAN